jgi:radical SAM-linked protein
MCVAIWESTSSWQGRVVASGEFRLRATYRKSGRLRWLSHLEMTRALERGVRRAGLPYAVSKGFHPHMRIAFGPALPVGTAGERECFDVWVTRYLPATDARSLLADSLPEGLMVQDAHYVPASVPALSSGALVGVYDVLVEGKEVTATQVQAALAKTIATGTLEVERRRKTKVFDLARTLPKEPDVRSQDGAIVVKVAVRIGPEGSLRPEVLLTVALDDAGLDGAVTAVTRTDMLVESEEGTWTRPA